MHQLRPQGSSKSSLPFLAALAIALGSSTLASPLALAQPSSQVELYDYTVVPGDSCVGIATRELGARKAYKTIHKYNALGPTPHRLRPGSILRLPRRQTVADAKVSSAVGKVQFRKAVEPLWSKANFGQELYRSWRVWSQKKSTALVTFRDNSSVSLRSDTILVIYGPAGSNARQRIVRADLESGGLRTRLAALENKLIVQTESSRIELRGGSSVISADARTQSTSISNHEGRAMRVNSRRKRRTKAVSVAPGKGTWVDRGKAPAPPRDLPEAPTLTTTSALALGLAHKGVAIHGQFTRVAAAEKYRVEIAIDPAVRIVLAAFELPKTT
ncbi:MAG: FecR domain-containing protein, partial [Kofleriaceae bacterium]|nr:FecR domain-containing protein [Kofleriaceae bacterium]